MLVQNSDNLALRSLRSTVRGCLVISRTSRGVIGGAGAVPPPRKKKKKENLVPQEKVEMTLLRTRTFTIGPRSFGQAQHFRTLHQHTLGMIRSALHVLNHL